MNPEHKNEPVIVVTEDGSHSLYNAALHEHYHSKYGALQESVYVFIDKGFSLLVSEGKKKLNILEMGLGTGMNCFLTYLEAQKTGAAVYYTALETAPIGMEMAGMLNYAELLQAEKEADVFQKIHSSAWNGWVQLSDHFFLKKLKTPMQEFESEEKFDLVYYDAFGPAAQPELWTLEIFEKLYRMMNEGGVIVTYCAKGDVRRNMIAAGFRAERLPGPPRKREMLRARR